MPRSPSDLSRHAALLYSFSSTGNRWTLTRHNKSETVRVRGPLRVNSSLALQTALAHGLGLARVPRFVVHGALASGQWVEVLPERRSPEQGIFAVTSAREHLPDKTRAFIDHFRALIGEPAYWERVAKTAARRQRLADPRGASPRSALLAINEVTTSRGGCLRPPRFDP